MKFEAIGNKGKTDLLAYIAHKTGSELRVLDKGKGKGRLRVMTNNQEFNIVHVVLTGTIEISLENNRGKQLSGHSEKMQGALETKKSTTGNHGPTANTKFHHMLTVTESWMKST